MTCPFGARIPRVLSNNKVSYDTSAMVHSHLIHLLRPYLNCSAIQQQFILFHNVQYLRLESKAPCGGLTSEPILSLSRGHPFTFPLSEEFVRPLILSARINLHDSFLMKVSHLCYNIVYHSMNESLNCTLGRHSGHTTCWQQNVCAIAGFGVKLQFSFQKTFYHVGQFSVSKSRNVTYINVVAN